MPNELDAALETCVEAALSGPWDQALGQLASALNMIGCSLNTDGAASRLALPATSNYREMLVDFVGGGWSEHDLLARRGWPMAAAGAAAIVEDWSLRRRSVVDSLSTESSWSSGNGSTRWHRVQNWRSNLVAERRADHDRALLERTQPHLRRIVRVATVMAESRRRGAMDALGALGEPAACVDRWGASCR